MRIIPVLDLQNGVVVRGIAGRRDEYRPLVSRLVSGCRPEDVAESLRTHFGFAGLYLADLDAIAGAPFARSLYEELQRRGFRLWVDAGVVDQSMAAAVAQCGVQRVVVGLETVAGRDEVERIASALGDLALFSLDLRAGQPLGALDRWRSSDPFDIATQAIHAGMRRLLVLDLARVGVGAGTGTEELCARLVTTFPHVEVSAGGGIRGIEDLRRLRDLGVANVLVASALHDGRLTRAELAAL